MQSVALFLLKQKHASKTMQAKAKPKKNRYYRPVSFIRKDKDKDAVFAIHSHF
jgi:hypothetical protein